jgi:hypothetical protein
MINLTAPDGSNVAVDGTLVVRARRTVRGEAVGAKTRIDWPDMQFVQEGIEVVAPRIAAELSTFTSLTSRDGSQIWFNGKVATGPIRLLPSEQDGVVNSSIKLMGYRQYVTESSDQVRAVLKSNGGTVLP